MNIQSFFIVLQDRLVNTLDGPVVLEESLSIKE
jgi:hypothetical protein